jgi:hypothetical protein
MQLAFIAIISPLSYRENEANEAGQVKCLPHAAADTMASDSIVLVLLVTKSIHLNRSVANGDY